MKAVALNTPGAITGRRIPADAATALAVNAVSRVSFCRSLFLLLQDAP